MNTHIPQNTRTDWNKEPSITILIKPNSGPEMDISSNEQTSYLSIKILKIMSVIYLIASILMAFSTGPFIQYFYRKIRSLFLLHL
jgi:hypothetical protein